MEIRATSVPGYYASDAGRIMGPSGKWLRAKGSRYGHLSVWTPQGYRSVHRLICEAWHGPCPAGMECAHIDGNPANNTPGNLTWKTHADNMRDRERHGTVASGERHGSARLTWDLVRQIRTRYAAGDGSHRSLAREYGVSESTICHVVTGRKWRE